MSAPEKAPAPRTVSGREVSGRSARLARRAREAAAVRAWSTAPAFLALRVERVRLQVDVLMWAGILGGLAFTAVNVQAFAAAGQPPGWAGWWVAWLLDPMVSLVLIAVLRAEQVTARWQIATGPWVRRARWFCLAATYVMNTWTAWAALDAAGVVLHSVPPLVVFVAAEAVTDLRDKLTDAVHAAAHTRPADASAPERGPAAVAAVPDPSRLQQQTVGWSALWAPGGRVEPETEPFTVPIPALSANGSASVAGTAPRATAGWTSGPTSRAATKRPRGRVDGSRAPRPAAGRVLAADYLDRARRALAAEPDPGSVQVSAAWVRQVTGCSRGLSSRLARTLRDEQPPATGATATTRATTGADTGPDRAAGPAQRTGRAVNGRQEPAEGAVNAPASSATDDQRDTGEDAGSGASEPVRRAA